MYSYRLINMLLARHSCVAGVATQDFCRFHIYDSLDIITSLALCNIAMETQLGLRWVLPMTRVMSEEWGVENP
jgi:hypothetical protein